MESRTFVMAIGYSARCLAGNGAKVLWVEWPAAKPIN